MSQPFPMHQGAPTPPQPRPAPKRFGGMAIAALVLGIIALCGSPIPIVNTATIIAGLIGVIFAAIGLFGWRRIMAAIGGLAAIAGAAIGLMLQAHWGNETGTSPSSDAAAQCKNSSQTPPCWSTTGQWIDSNGVPNASDPTYQYSAPASTTSAPRPIEAGDFTITLKTVSKQCFGSYGCNVVVEPGITYKGTVDDLSAYGTCSITYSISGNKDGEVVDTAYGTGGTQFQVMRSALTTASSKVEPKATVTAVSCT